MDSETPAKHSPTLSAVEICTTSHEDLSIDNTDIPSSGVSDLDSQVAKFQQNTRSTDTKQLDTDLDKDRLETGNDVEASGLEEDAASVTGIQTADLVHEMNKAESRNVIDHDDLEESESSAGNVADQKNGDQEEGDGFNGEAKPNQSDLNDCDDDNNDSDDDFGDFDDFDEFEDGPAQEPPASEQPATSHPPLPTSATQISSIPCLYETDFANSAHLQASIEHILTGQDSASGSGGFAYTLVSANNTQIGVDDRQSASNSVVDFGMSRSSSAVNTSKSEDLADELSYSDVGDDEYAASIHTDSDLAVGPKDSTSSFSPTKQRADDGYNGMDPKYASSLSYFTVRSKSLWDQLAQAPSIGSQSNAVDWNRSAIRRCFLVSLGVPVDLDQVMPQKGKQKRLILPTTMSDAKSYNEKARGSRHGQQASVYAIGSVSSAGSEIQNRQRAQSLGVGGGSLPLSFVGEPGDGKGGNLVGNRSRNTEGRHDLALQTQEEEAALAEWSQLVTVSELAIKNMSVEELKEYIGSVAEALGSANNAYTRWVARRDDALKDKAAFEGVIESLVDYAQRVGKNGGKKGKGTSGSGTNSPSFGGSNSNGNGSPGQKKQSSTVGRANSFLRRRKTDL